MYDSVGRTKHRAQLQRLHFRLVTVAPIKYSSLCYQVHEEKANATTEVQNDPVAPQGSAAKTLTLEGGATKKTEMLSNQARAAQRTQLASSPERYDTTIHFSCV